MRTAPEEEEAPDDPRSALAQLAGPAGDLWVLRREGSLDERLLAWLRGHAGRPDLEFAEPPRLMEGGLDTRNYRFELSDPPPGLKGPLVLRLYTRQHKKARMARESAIQSVLAGRSLPVASVRLVCEDSDPLNGPFFIMDCLPGEPMNPLDPDHVRLLGREHAALHREASESVEATLRELGRWRPRYRVPDEIRVLLERAGPHAALLPTVEWLAENMPPEPEKLSICHGDYHPLNILVRDGAVSGILDWPEFMVADPMLDVAGTLTICRVARHLLGDDAAARVSGIYLDAYKESADVDPSKLEYFTVRRCILGLLDGVAGRKVWRHPPIVADLSDEILRITGRAPVKPSNASGVSFDV